jgi:hypothetical protein
MLVLLDHFLSFVAVGLVLLNLFLESCKHSFPWLWCFRFLSLNVCAVFRLIFIGIIFEFICEFTNEATELLVSTTGFVIALRCRVRCLLLDNYLFNDLRLLLIWQFSSFCLWICFTVSLWYLLWYSCILSCWLCYHCFWSFDFLRFKRIIKSLLHFWFRCLNLIGLILRILLSLFSLDHSFSGFVGYLACILNHFGKRSKTLILVFIFWLLLGNSVYLIIVRLGIRN